MLSACASKVEADDYAVLLPGRERGKEGAVPADVLG